LAKFICKSVCAVEAIKSNLILKSDLSFKSFIFQGDSGGALVSFQPRPIQIGVLQFGSASCGYNHTRPAVYMSVGYFRTWINYVLALP